jgi:hypothetical protein
MSFSAFVGNKSQFGQPQRLSHYFPPSFALCFFSSECNSRKKLDCATKASTITLRQEMAQVSDTNAKDNGVENDIKLRGDHVFVSRISRSFHVIVVSVENMSRMSSRTSSETVRSRQTCSLRNCRDCDVLIRIWQYRKRYH